MTASILLAKIVELTNYYLQSHVNLVWARAVKTGPADCGMGRVMTMKSATAHQCIRNKEYLFKISTFVLP